jgi:Zn-dependent protease
MSGISGGCGIDPDSGQSRGHMTSGSLAKEGAMSFIADAIISVAIHEIAHVVAAWSMGVQVHQIGITWKGPFIRRDFGTTGQNLAITLAGPCSNLLLALSLHPISPRFALINLVLGACNFLPFPSSDGLRALRLVKILARQCTSRLEHQREQGEQEPIRSFDDDWHNDEAA